MPPRRSAVPGMGGTKRAKFRAVDPDIVADVHGDAPPPTQTPTYPVTNNRSYQVYEDQLGNIKTQYQDNEISPLPAEILAIFASEQDEDNLIGPPAADYLDEPIEVDAQDVSNVPKKTKRSRPEQINAVREPLPLCTCI